MDWPQGSAQQTGERTQDSSRKPRVRLPEVPKLGLKNLTDKNYRHWTMDMDLQLGTYWIEIDALLKKVRKSKDPITEDAYS